MSRPRYHVVRITEKGYWRLSSSSTREVAVEATLVASTRAHDPVVLRDGETGKRFSVAELRA